MPDKVSPITKAQIREALARAKQRTPEQIKSDEEFWKRTKARHMEERTQQEKGESTKE